MTDSCPRQRPRVGGSRYGSGSSSLMGISSFYSFAAVVVCCDSQYGHWYSSRSSPAYLALDDQDSSHSKQITLTIASEPRDGGSRYGSGSSSLMGTSSFYSVPVRVALQFGHFVGFVVLIRSPHSQQITACSLISITGLRAFAAAVCDASGVPVVVEVLDPHFVSHRVLRVSNVLAPTPDHEPVVLDERVKAHVGTALVADDFRPSTRHRRHLRNHSLRDPCIRRKFP